MKLNHIDVIKLRLDIVALPDKYVDEVLSTYAMHEPVQKIDAVSLWERRPMKQLPGHTILQCKASVREIEDEPNAIHFELLDNAMDLMRERLGHFSMYRAMPWAWRTMQYEKQSVYQGVADRTEHSATGNSGELREVLMDRIALNIVVEYL